MPEEAVGRSTPGETALRLPYWADLSWPEALEQARQVAMQVGGASIDPTSLAGPVLTLAVLALGQRPQSTVNDLLLFVDTLFTVPSLGGVA